MEELLVMLLQAGLEALAEIVFYLPFDLLGCSWPKTSSGSALLFFIIGAGVGAISVAACHDTLIRSEVLRVLNLTLAPILSGTLVSGLARLRRHSTESRLFRVCFWRAAMFTLALALVRFTYCHR